MPGQQVSASKHLFTIRRGAQTVGEYTIEFRILAAEVGWNNEALVAAFFQGLCDIIKDEIAACDLPKDLDELISFTTLIDMRIRERLSFRERLRRLPSRLAPNFTYPPSPPSPPMPPRADSTGSEPMQLGVTQLSTKIFGDMKKILVLFAVHIGIYGCLANHDLNGYAFLFSKESSNSYVRLLPEKEGPFDAFTVCMKSYPDLTRSYSLFSLNTPSQDNDFLVFPYPTPSNKLSVSVGGKDFYFNVPYSKDVEWISTCVSWDSSTGVLVLWINGKPYPRKVFQKGYRIKAKPFIVIGQEQDSYGGGFDISQSFVGEISDVHVWDKALTYMEMFAVLHNNCINGNVINWRSLKYEVHGGAMLLPRQYKINVS
ncbi:serum amyloid P-component-like [Rhinophrynus dorsalis]